MMFWYGQFIGKPVTDGLLKHFPWPVCVGGDIFTRSIVM